MDKISMSESLRNNEVFSVKKLSNPKIFTTKNGKLEEIDEVTEGDVRVLEEAGILRDTLQPTSTNFDLDSDYFPPAFVKEMIEAVREKYSDVAAELPISFVDSRLVNSETPIESSSGLVVLYSRNHSKLILKKLLPSGKTEVYVLDVSNNSPDSYLDEACGNSEKFVVKYPVTALTQDEWLGESLGIQYDYTNCISYAVHFAKKIYKAVREEKTRSEENVLESFNRVVSSFKICGTKLRADNRKSVPIFAMPDFLLRCSGSEGALNNMIRARVKTECKSVREEITEHLKSKLMPYKIKRREELEKLNQRPKGGLVSTGCRLLTYREMAGGIEIELCKTYSPAQNWRNKDIKRMAERLRIIKEKDKEKDRDRGREDRGLANFPAVLLGLQGFLLKIWRITVVVLLRIQTVLLASLRLERAGGVNRNRRIAEATEELNVRLTRSSAKSHHE
jgi:hypothetical protein